MDSPKEHDFSGPMDRCTGCERFVEECMEHRFCTPKPFEDLGQLLGCLAQFMDAVKPEIGPDWSEHDQAMRDAISRHLRKFANAEGGLRPKTSAPANGGGEASMSPFRPIVAQFIHSQAPWHTEEQINAYLDASARACCPECGQKRCDHNRTHVIPALKSRTP